MKPNRALSIAIFIGLLWNGTSASAQDLCSGLKRALQSAGERFAPLRGRYDTSFGEYGANISFGAAADCKIDTGRGVSSMECKQEFGSQADARSAYLGFVGAVETCFRSGIKRTRSPNPHVTWFRHEETDDDVRIRLGVITNRRGGEPPLYYVAIEVTHVDPRE